MAPLLSFEKPAPGVREAGYHMMLLDLRGTGVTGKELERRLDEVYITANKNAIPNVTMSA